MAEAAGGACDPLPGVVGIAQDTVEGAGVFRPMAVPLKLSPEEHWPLPLHNEQSAHYSHRRPHRAYNRTTISYKLVTYLVLSAFY